jgi:hypothetical protein
VKGKTMKTFIAFAFIAVLSTGVFSQPLSGSYTIGGNNPDFSTPQAAKYALVARGVSGPTFFNIRPGVYTENGGTSRVLSLDSAIAGLSAANRITFQADASTGGNVDNCIFEINFIDPNNNNSSLVWVRVPYITFRSITFRDTDSLQAGAIYLMRCQARTNSLFEGLIVDGCKFIGNPYIRGNAQFGTDYGISVAPQLSKDVTVRNSSFTQLRRAIYIGEYNSTTAGKVIIEDNEFSLPHSGYSGSGAGIGSQINAHGDTLIIRQNYIDLINGNGCFLGIYLTVGYTGFIEQNIVKNRQLRDNGGTPESFTGIFVSDLYFRDADSVLVANNMVSGNKTLGDGLLTSLDVQVPNAKVYNNTLVGTTQNTKTIGINLRGANARVFNNIIQIYGSGGFLPYRMACDFGNQNQSPGLVSNYNVMEIFNTTGTFIKHNAITYATLGEWQLTGQDTNSNTHSIDFIDFNDDPHLTDCQMQDPDLIGIPFSDVTVDFDGDNRSTTSPTIGADEAVINNNRIFGEPFREILSGIPFSIAAGKFDNATSDGIAVPDFDNNQVRLYHNNASTRSFTLSNTLSLNFTPISVLFHDFDEDGHLDLIIGGRDPHTIKVYWGDGAGGFPQTSEIQTPHAVENLVPEPYRLFQDFQLIFVPMGQVFGYLFNLGNRQLCFDLQYSSSGLIDTLGSFIHSIQTADLNGDNILEIAGIGHSDGKFAFWGDITGVIVANQPCMSTQMQRGSPYVEFDFGTGWYSYANSIISGDFDGDTDIDFVTAGFSSSTIIYIWNLGSFNFTSDTISVDHPVHALVAMDYDLDGDLDFVTANWSDQNGITTYINDGFGNFDDFVSCYQELIDNKPLGILARDFDVDGLTDIAVVTIAGELSVLYNMLAVTPVEEQEVDLLPDTYSLEQNYPNPFNPSTTIQFSLPNSGDVTLKIYNLLGEEVKTLVEEYREAGKHSVQFSANSLSSGIYFYSLQAGSFNQVKKMILIK